MAEWVRNNVSITGASAQNVVNQPIYLEKLKNIRNNILAFDNQVDSLLSDVDAFVKSSLKDPDKNVEYLKVLSQLDYNTNKPDNNTLYFINNIEEPISRLGLILDMVADDKAVWVLTYKKDTSLELEERDKVILWKSVVINKVIATTEFFKVKTWNGFKDGRLVLDGHWVFDDDNFQAYLNTSDEPFVALISIEDELYGFPSLRFDVTPNEDEEDDEIDLETVNIRKLGSAFKIAGNANPPNNEEPEKVLYVSLEKGYCSEAFKGNDQGIIVVYLTRQGSNSTTAIKYLQYGYPENDSTEKVWSPEYTIASRADIFSVEVRRLSDYRIGITYCYRTNEYDEYNNRINKSCFIYSTKRTYAGTAVRATNFSIPSVYTDVGFDTVLYGAVRNDNIDEVPKVDMNIMEMVALHGSMGGGIEDKYIIINEKQKHRNVKSFEEWLEEWLKMHARPDSDDELMELYMQDTNLSKVTPDSMNGWLRHNGILVIPLCFFTKPVSPEEEMKPLTFEILNSNGALISKDIFEKIDEGGSSFSKTHLQIGSISIDIQNEYPFEQNIVDEVMLMSMAYKAAIQGWSTIPLMKKYYNEDVDSGEVVLPDYSEQELSDNEVIQDEDGVLYKVGTAILLWLEGIGPATGRKDDPYWADYYNCDTNYIGPFSPFTITVSANNIDPDVRIRFLANDLCLSSKHNYEMGNYFCLGDVKASYHFSRGLDKLGSVSEGVFYPVGSGGSYGFQTVLSNYGCTEPVDFFDEKKLSQALKTGRQTANYNMPFLEMTVTGSNKVVYPSNENNNFNINFGFNIEVNSSIYNSNVCTKEFEDYINFNFRLGAQATLINGGYDDI